VAEAAWRRRFLGRRCSALPGPALRERRVCGGRAPLRRAERTHTVRFPIGAASAARLLSALQWGGEAPQPNQCAGDPGETLPSKITRG